MNVLYILGSIGGIIAGIEVALKWLNIFVGWHRHYIKVQAYYERNHKRDEKIPMGFMTEKERAEVEDRLMAKRGA